MIVIINHQAQQTGFIFILFIENRTRRLCLMVDDYQLMHLHNWTIFTTFSVTFRIFPKAYINVMKHYSSDIMFLVKP
jgi:hypothetical protein